MILVRLQLAVYQACHRVCLHPEVAYPLALLDFPECHPDQWPEDF